MFGDRTQLRSQFLDAWAKVKNKELLTPLEAQIVAVIEEHPEYHSLFNDREQALHAEFPPEQGQGNPFLHLAMHLSLREQSATDRPQGIQSLHRTLCEQFGVMDAEHRMLECLGEVLWAAQRQGSMPDEQVYLECLQRILPSQRR